MFWAKMLEVLLRRPQPGSERSGKARDIAVVKSQADAATIRVRRALAEMTDDVTVRR